MLINHRIEGWGLCGKGAYSGRGLIQAYQYLARQ